MLLSSVVTQPQAAEDTVRLFLMAADPSLGAGKDDTGRLDAGEQTYNALCVAAQQIYTGPDDQDQRRGFAGATTWTGFQALWKAVALLIHEGRRVVLAMKRLMADTSNAWIRDRAQSVRMRAANLITLFHKIQRQLRAHLQAGQKADAFLRTIADGQTDPRVVLTRYLRAQTPSWHQAFPG